MRKGMKKVSLLLLGMVLLVGSSRVAYAGEKTYTYNYDFWGDYQYSPDTYNVSGVYTAVDLGLNKQLKNPEGLFVSGKTIYICDTGNNRIVELQRISQEKFELVRYIDSFLGTGGEDTFQSPTDVAVSEDGFIFIADKGNGRILKLDKDLNYIMEFRKPNDTTLDESLTFQPNKIVVDTAGRVYCTAIGINKGLIKYENDGTFAGFVGATKVTYDFVDYVWKKFATQEQRAQMESFVPTEYDNIYMDYEGFIYAVAGKVDEEALDRGDASAVRRLNLMGNDILVQNGEFPALGDLYWGKGGGHEGPSYFTDVTTFDNDIYICLDKNRGRIFGYDDQGRMLYAFGGNGNINGYFRQPTAIEHMDYDLLVLDTLDCSITLFTPTEFGRLIYQAIDEFNSGSYAESGATWQKVMNIDGNYDLAYIGIGRSLLRQEEYKRAMEYFELKYDDENYSKAFKQYRKIWVEEHIGIIIAILLVIILIPLIIGRVKAIRHEIDTADIFKS